LYAAFFEPWHDTQIATRNAIHRPRDSLNAQYQCVASVPSTMGVSRPLELESYAKWIYLLEWPTKLDFFPPVECFGGFHRLLLISSFWPLGLILLVSVASIGLESGARRKRHILATTRAGLQGALPTILVLTFLVLPNTATRIFNSFVCETYKLDDAAGLFRRYLRDDMSLSCDSAEFGEMRTDAIILMAVWPCGVPLMYAALLWASRRAIIDDTPTPLSRSVGFLSNDCALAHAIKDMLPIPHSASSSHSFLLPSFPHCGPGPARRL
jgi:hypothetical protein